jgi:hypothetical protein
MAVTDSNGQQLRDHAFARLYCRGQYLDCHSVIAGFHHPLGSSNMLEDRVANLKAFGLPAGSFRQEQALLLRSQHPLLSRLDLVCGTTKEYSQQEQSGSAGDPSRGVDVTDSVSELDNGEQ